MLFNKEKNFCDINPFFYALSREKEILRRKLKDMLSNQKFAKTIKKEKLPNVIFSYSSHLIKKGKDIDPILQENKVVNIKLACNRLNGIIIHPGEVFSFWRIVGRATRAKGYKNGRVIVNSKLIPGVGGGLCNLGNTINYLVIHSPLNITEFHHHSDALSPDVGERNPFSSGTSVSYNYIDYRFQNNTDQDIQLCIWCEDNELKGELRSERNFPWQYEIVEEGHHFQKENDKYYRISRIYKKTINKITKEIIDKELILDNHSLVMYDYNLIPKDQIEV